MIQTKEKTIRPTSRILSIFHTENRGSGAPLLPKVSHWDKLTFIYKACIKHLIKTEALIPFYFDKDLKKKLPEALEKMTNEWKDIEWFQLPSCFAGIWMTIAVICAVLWVETCSGDMWVI